MITRGGDQINFGIYREAQKPRLNLINAGVDIWIYIYIIYIYKDYLYIYIWISGGLGGFLARRQILNLVRLMMLR